ncbi:ABC transporter permease [Pseudooceanicola sp. CBS1P-1]|uniref:ABC transporter permease subunit n=1 Tax=Pseudooceanicola albus TaxID=2692189 RepID=A0A6L7G7Y6_9RHOB|nr:MULTISPECIES: ABC transporter permease [Pseudooceanicola]MBT9386053.1 ABC transporter permease [Pseudooceanicola endophyticus]MXN19526.1 ABC transporter permease subunit [Pseudooceanicola albus]
MRLYALAVYAFLYLPIAIIALFSFSAGRSAASLQGFSVHWYHKALHNPFVLEALWTSVRVAFLSALLATIAGTLASLALTGMRGRVRAIFDTLVQVAVMIPGIVIGIATLIALVSVFDLVNPWLEPLTGLKLSLGTGSLVAAHGLFTMSLVILLVRGRMESLDPALIEASGDLGATPVATFFQVTLPQILPAIMAGFLLAFTFSFDDFIIAFFVAGSDTTLPIYIFSSIRRGVTPEINAIGTMVMGASLTILIVAQVMLRRSQAQPRP